MKQEFSNALPQLHNKIVNFHRSQTRAGKEQHQQPLLLKPHSWHPLDDKSFQVLIPLGTLFLDDPVARVRLSTLHASTRISSPTSDLLAIDIAVFVFIVVAACSMAVPLVVVWSQVQLVKVQLVDVFRTHTLEFDFLETGRVNVAAGFVELVDGDSLELEVWVDDPVDFGGAGRW